MLAAHALPCPARPHATGRIDKARSAQLRKMGLARVQEATFAFSDPEIVWDQTQAPASELFCRLSRPCRSQYAAHHLPPSDEPKVRVTLYERLVHAPNGSETMKTC